MAQWLALSPRGESDPGLWGICMDFLPLTKDIQVRSIGEPVFPRGVNVSVTESQFAGQSLTDLFTLPQVFHCLREFTSFGAWV